MASPRPIPPATNTGTSRISGRISWASTLVETGPIWPPASIPSMMIASAPERSSFLASTSAGAKHITLARPVRMRAMAAPGGSPPASTMWPTRWSRQTSTSSSSLGCMVIRLTPNGRSVSAVVAAHADADHRHLADIGIGHQRPVTELLLAVLEHLDGPLEIGLRHREGEVGRAAALGDVLDDHVDIDAGIGERPEDRRRHAGPVGHPRQGDLGLVAIVGDAADHFLFHDLILIDPQAARPILDA